jgi:hypothetical protein
LFLLIFNNNNYPVLDYLFLFKESKKKKKPIQNFFVQIFLFFLSVVREQNKRKNNVALQAEEEPGSQGQKVLA